MPKLYPLVVVQVDNNVALLNTERLELCNQCSTSLLYWPKALSPTRPDVFDVIQLRSLIHEILESYALPWNGYHGVAHWARVLENGRRLCEETGADLEVVSLFALFHDSQRFNESTDPNHGQRGADFATQLRGSTFELEDPEFHLLYRACAGHTHERTQPDLTIQTCWDSDRLDLGRVGIQPHPSRLCTDVAKRPETIKWADGRACFEVIPEFVAKEWGILLD